MEQYLVQRKLGEGGFGEAYLVKSSVSGRAYVMKKIMISTVMQTTYSSVLSCMKTIVRNWIDTEPTTSR